MASETRGLPRDHPWRTLFLLENEVPLPFPGVLDSLPCPTQVLHVAGFNLLFLHELRSPTPQKPLAAASGAARAPSGLAKNGAGR